MRLKTWHWIGIAASVVWLFIGAWCGNELGLQLGDFAIAALRHCLDGPSSNGWQECTANFNRDYKAALAGYWYVVAGIEVIPIPLAWLLAYAGMGIFRRIRHASMHRPERTLIGR